MRGRARASTRSCSCAAGSTTRTRARPARRAEVERFEPTPEEVEAAREKAAREPQGPQPLRLHLDAAATGVPATIIDDLKHVLGNHPARARSCSTSTTSGGARTLRFGEEFRVAATPSLRAELEHILGPAALRTSLA